MQPYGNVFLACEEEMPMSGVVEVDESLFGARRVKGKRGRGAYGETTVFGIFERDGKSIRKSCQTVQKLLYKAS